MKPVMHYQQLIVGHNTKADHSSSCLAVCDLDLASR